MGEEVRMSDYENGSGSGGDDDRVFDWEAGLPVLHDLTPLSQTLIPPDLASAFRICPEPSRSMFDVNRESQKTMTSIRGGGGGDGGNGHHSQTFLSSNNLKNFKSFDDETTAAAVRARDQMTIDIDDADLTREGSDSRKTRKVMETGSGSGTEEADSSAVPKSMENCGDDGSARTLKRPRLVWTPQLHKRFVDVVGHLGIKNAVPKTIMQLMNVEGLTRENVASHLQKYRLYLKRMQGLSTEGPSPSDHLFASTPVPQSLHESAGSASANGHGNSNGHMGMPIQMPYQPPAGAQMMPMIGISGPGGGGYHGYDHHHQYSMVPMQPMDWSGNKFAHYHHHVGQNDK